MHHRRLINEASDLSGSSPASRGFTFILDKPTMHNLHPAVTHTGGGTSSVGWMLRLLKLRVVDVKDSFMRDTSRTNRCVLGFFFQTHATFISSSETQKITLSYSSVMYVGDYEHGHNYYEHNANVVPSSSAFPFLPGRLSHMRFLMSTFNLISTV